MTETWMGMAVMSAVVGGSFLIGMYWIRIERLRARELAVDPATAHSGLVPNGQGVIKFAESRELVATGGQER